MNTVTFKVGGMVCDGCAANVERTLATLQGIANCQVNYANEQATVQYNPQQIAAAAIQAEVEAVGFTLQRL